MGAFSIDKKKKAGLISLPTESRPHCRQFLCEDPVHCKDPARCGVLCGGVLRVTGTTMQVTNVLSSSLSFATGKKLECRPEKIVMMWDLLQIHFGYGITQQHISNFKHKSLSSYMQSCLYHWIMDIWKMISHALIARCKWMCFQSMMPCCSLVYQHTLDTIVLYQTFKSAMNRTLYSFQIRLTDVPWTAQTRHCYDAFNSILLHRVQRAWRLAYIHFVWHRRWRMQHNSACHLQTGGSLFWRFRQQTFVKQEQSLKRNTQSSLQLKTMLDAN